MSIQQTRFGAQPQPAQVIQFPKFAASLPAYEKDVDVRLGEQAPDVFAKETPRQARITLLPKTQAHLKQFATDASGKEGLIDKLFANALLGKEQDSPTVNTVAYVETTDAPKADKTEKKLSAKDAKTQAASLSEQKAAVGRQNTTALLEAFEAKLDSLGDDVKDVSAVLPKPLPYGVKADTLVRDMARIAVNKGYNYRFFKADSAIRTALETVTLSRAAVNTQAAVRKGEVLGHAMNLTRHLVDSPANHATTRYVSDAALKLRSGTMDVQVLSDGDLEGTTEKNDKKMGLFLSVAQGNDPFAPDRKPRLVEMVHTPKDWDPATGKTVVLVGKGIIFDTGGNDLKPSEHHHNMRGDMGGAAAVLGAMKALDELPVGVRVVGLMPLTENRLSGSASLEQDVYTARSGMNAYIENTDAEGRLVMADAMNYGLEKYGPDAAFSIATLTGAKTIAVGEKNAVGVMGNNAEMMDAVNSVIRDDLGRTTGQVLIDQKYHDMVTVKGEGPADIQNASRGRHMQIAGVYDDVEGADPKAIAKAVLDKDAFGKLINGNPALKQRHMESAMADGGAFVQGAGMVSIEKDADGKITDVKQHNVPWTHLDIAGSEFGSMDPKRGNHEWASGIGVEDLYLALEGIGKGEVKINANKNVLPELNILPKETKKKQPYTFK